ncbi:MAG: hypothetical protein KAH99_04710 [Verrucomicrobia bacterium]|nr:hypothetical protein [Verrucomicrobiota bacterium]
MQSNQHKVVMEVLRRLEKAGVLEGIVLVGSWCLYFYRSYFSEKDAFSILRTRDIDFLVPTPPRRLKTADIPELLDDLGFVQQVKAGGYIQLMHPEVMLEFLVAERGRGSDKPYPLPQLGLNAQSLRFMDIADEFSIRLEYEGIMLRVPHPAAFALHKLIIVPRRKNKAKALRDTQSAVEILNLLFHTDDTAMMAELLRGFPPSWKKTIYQVLSDSESELVDQLRQLDL